VKKRRRIHASTRAEQHRHDAAEERQPARGRTNGSFNTARYLTGDFDAPVARLGRVVAGS
jgi:hypothetical protein